MDNCPFCQIVSGKKPCFKVYEDAHFFGFLDDQPLTEGHTLLIPKKHHRWLWEIDTPGLCKAAAAISRQLIGKLRCDFVTYLSMGKMIPHAHLHLIPRRNNDGLLLWEGSQHQPIPARNMQQIAHKLLSSFC